DLCIVGTDRTTATGDVANKIGTYLKALAARDNDIPFLVALPYSTIDWSLDDGSSIPIEERDPDEVTDIVGRLDDGRVATVRIAPARTACRKFRLRRHAGAARPGLHHRAGRHACTPRRPTHTLPRARQALCSVSLIGISL